MNGKRSVPLVSRSQSRAPRWSESETQRLKDYLEDGKINLYDSASQIKSQDDIFSQFSNSVVGYHMGLLRKRKLASAPRAKCEPVKDVLKQLGVVPVSSMQKSENIARVHDQTGETSEPLTYKNMPFLRFSYMDYDSKQEKLVVLVDLPGGSGNFEWEFNDEGDGIIIKVEWSKALCDASHLFIDTLKAKMITLAHPKLHAMQDQLLSEGIGLNEIPKFVIEIDLGKRVHKDD
ncbi:hypothetical protein Bhyg_07896, partial [Pseudolycoriella hygida]